MAVIILLNNYSHFRWPSCVPLPFQMIFSAPPPQKKSSQSAYAVLNILHFSKSHCIIKLNILLPWIAIIWMPKNANQLNYVAKTFKTHFPVFQKWFRLFISQYEEIGCSCSLQWYRLVIKGRVCTYCLQCYRLFIKSCLIGQA